MKDGSGNPIPRGPSNGLMLPHSLDGFRFAGLESPVLRTDDFLKDNFRQLVAERGVDYVQKLIDDIKAEIGTPIGQRLDADRFARLGDEVLHEAQQ